MATRCGKGRTGDGASGEVIALACGRGRTGEGARGEVMLAAAKAVPATNNAARTEFLSFNDLAFIGGSTPWFRTSVPEE
jgi:hypothetical protein